jgi:hypothetical protein
MPSWGQKAHGTVNVLTAGRGVRTGEGGENRVGWFRESGRRADDDGVEGPGTAGGLVESNDQGLAGPPPKSRWATQGLW